MSVNFPFYLRLVLLQGGCLAVGFFLQSYLLVGTAESSAGGTPFPAWSSERLAALSGSYLTMWGLSTGGTGLLIMQEQRRQLLIVLKRHSAPDDNDFDLSLLSDSEEDSENLVETANVPLLQLIRWETSTPRLRIAVPESTGRTARRGDCEIIDHDQMSYPMHPRATME